MGIRFSPSESGFSLLELMIVLAVTSTGSIYLANEASQSITKGIRDAFRQSVLEARSEIISNLANASACRKSFSGTIKYSKVDSIFSGAKIRNTASSEFQSMFMVGTSSHLSALTVLKDITVVEGPPPSNTGLMKVDFTFSRALRGNETIESTIPIFLLAEMDEAGNVVSCQTYEGDDEIKSKFFCDNTSTECSQRPNYCAAEFFKSESGKCLCTGVKVGGDSASGKSCEQDLVALAALEKKADPVVPPVTPDPDPSVSPGPAASVSPAPAIEVADTGMTFIKTPHTCASTDPAKNCIETGFQFNPKTNPFLAGMPNGTVSKGGYGEVDDIATDSTASMISGSMIVPGNILEFSATGTATISPTTAIWTPDGNMAPYGSWGRSAVSNAGSENGIPFNFAPGAALVAIFIGPDAPDKTPLPILNDADCPNSLNGPAEWDRLEYRPKLKQIFFIGDGKTAAGVSQKFTVPEGATRLYFTIQDTSEWNNNGGSLTIDMRSQKP